MSLLEALVLVSEKAANIARICREDENLFQLFVQDKTDDANPRFVQDFKTLADVLIQEMIKKDIISKFPELKGKIRGEEDNTFENTMGESITVEIKENGEETARLLEIVLNGHRHVADLLAIEVHKDILMDSIPSNNCSNINIDVDMKDLGIWIDPIDFTAEYINAIDTIQNNGIYLTGLRCVTVLIGGYSLSSGKCIIGIVNQPFSQYENKIWNGTCYWGISTANISTTSQTTISNSLQLKNVICISSSEDSYLRKKLSTIGYQLIEVAGAGYKILTVITGLCDAYVLSKGTTFMWDTCGPQAVLKAMGGNIVKYSSQQVAEELLYQNVTEDKIVKCGNKSGIIAYRDEEILHKIIKALESTTLE